MEVILKKWVLCILSMGLVFSWSYLATKLVEANRLFFYGPIYEYKENGNTDVCGEKEGKLN